MWPKVGLSRAKQRTPEGIAKPVLITHKEANPVRRETELPVHSLAFFWHFCGHSLDSENAKTPLATRGGTVSQDLEEI